MVIRGGTRGNVKQYAKYLMTIGDNEKIEILEVDGRRNATPEYLEQVLMSMGAMAELTKSEKAIHRCEINPAYGEDKNMDWFKAADIAGSKLELTGQRRIIVLHTKKGRTHAHVAWERYDYETGTMKPDSFSRLAQDRARKEMEIEFGHKRTPHRNAHRPELKASLLQLWNQTATGAQFLNACKNNNYMLAQGSGRSQFIVVDEKGRSFDLVRQLTGIRLKDVRYRMRNETLMTEKAAITYMRNKADRETDGEEKQKAKFTPTAKRATVQFAENRQDGTTQKPEQKAERFTTAKEQLTGKQPDAQPTPKDKKQTITTEFTENRQDKTLTERERVRQAFAKQRQEMQQRDQSRDAGYELD